MTTKAGEHGAGSGGKPTAFAAGGAQTWSLLPSDVNKTAHAVRLAEDPTGARDFFAAAREAGEDVHAGLALARDYGRALPLPGRGETATRWQLLAEVAARDLTCARILEAHTDALAILGEAGVEDVEGTWGVFAAEGPDLRVDARVDGETTVLEGTKPWCSLAGQLDRALVTAHVGGERQLFAVDLRHPSVQVSPPAGWVARGLRHVPSGPVHFARTPARPVGGPGWYLTRDGFAWGGMGVAACWYGGALALGRSLATWSDSRPGDLAALHVGVVDAALHGAGATLADAARRVDDGRASGARGALLALRVRAVIADAAERTLTQTAHALGPAPLAFDEEHARRVADLQIYLRQHHAERDLAALGRASREEPE